jgi:hypothetical protein
MIDRNPPDPPLQKALPGFQWVKSADRSVPGNSSNCSAAGTVSRPTLSSAEGRRVGHRADRKPLATSDHVYPLKIPKLLS